VLNHIFLPNLDRFTVLGIEDCEMGSDTLHGLGDTILDRYELVRLLGSGGWGRVYLANDRMLHRPVAIKQLLTRLAADPAAVSRFLREATVIASIREPHVVTIHDIAERDGQHYMVMEYADAGTLAQVLQLEGTITPYESLSVAIDVCKGLRAVHNKGIIHRDVKPANVMFFSRSDGLPVAKIGDFGIALGPQDERLTPIDNVVGTLIYLSPEQASSTPVITQASDLYSLGVVLYEMMSGELEEPLFLNPLFSNGDSSEIYQQLTLFPDPVRPLLIKALKRKPDDRFQDADEMLQALQRARSRLTVSFTTQTFEPIASEELQSVPKPEPQVEPKPRFPARLLAIAAITFVLLVAGGMATFGLVSGSTRPTPEPTSAAVVSGPTQTHTPTTAPTATLTAVPSVTPTFGPSPSLAASPSPSPTAESGFAVPTRVIGQPNLTVVFRDTVNGVDEVTNSPSAATITYLEDSYLWGEVVTQIGNTVFRINRDAPDPDDQTQRLPSYLRINIDYSNALKQAMREEDRGGEDFVAQTGEFWVGHFRCGSAIPAERSPYRMTVQLLEDGREIARQQYVIGVLSKPGCGAGGSDDDSGNPPKQR
jgi:serine/threonine protein kinase